MIWGGREGGVRALSNRQHTRHNTCKVIRNLPLARARGKNNAALPLECRKMDLHPVITGFLLAIIFAAFLIVGFVS